jgi:predicted membrane-bound spermidine synthase
MIGNLLRLAWLVLAAWPAYKYYGTLGIIAIFVSVELFALIYFFYKARVLKVLKIRFEFLYLIVFVCTLAIGILLEEEINLIVRSAYPI